MKKIIIILSLIIIISTGCKKSMGSGSNNCTTNNVCTVVFTNDYSSALDIKVYDANNKLRLTITGVSAGASVTRDTVPAGEVKIVWSRGTLSGTLLHYNIDVTRRKKEEFLKMIGS